MHTTYIAEEAATMPHDSPLLRVHSLRSDEGSITLNELTVLCKQLSTKVAILEADLKQTIKGRHEHDFKEPDFEFTAPKEDYTAKPDIKLLFSIHQRRAAKRKDKAQRIRKKPEPFKEDQSYKLEQKYLGLKSSEIARTLDERKGKE
ncbi:hypothetical protein Tco_0410051 [Tanacetum coccineum]